MNASLGYIWINFGIVAYYHDYKVLKINVCSWKDAGDIFNWRHLMMQTNYIFHEQVIKNDRYHSVATCHYHLV